MPLGCFPRPIAGTAAALEILEQRLVMSQVSWTGAGGDLSWQDARNWSTGSVPGATDDVSGNPTIVFNGTATIQNLADGDSLDIAGGSLTLTSDGALHTHQNKESRPCPSPDRIPERQALYNTKFRAIKINKSGAHDRRDERLKTRACRFIVEGRPRCPLQDRPKRRSAGDRLARRAWSGPRLMASRRRTPPGRSAGKLAAIGLVPRPVMVLVARPPQRRSRADAR